MNILVLTSVYPYPGQMDENTTKVVQYFAHAWKEQGHNVIVIHNSHRYPLFVHLMPEKLKSKLSTRLSFHIPGIEATKRKIYNDKGVKVCRLPILKLKPHGDHLSFLVDRQAEKIHRVLDKEKFVPDVIVGHWMSPQIQIISKLRKYYACRTALVLHGRGYLGKGEFNWRKYIGAVDIFGCRSKTEAKYVKRALCLNYDPFICYSGIPDDYVNNNPFDNNRFLEKPKKWKIICVSRLVEYKKIDAIILALSKIKSFDFELEIIGDGEELKNLKRLTNELNIRDKVLFLGSVSREIVLDHLKKSHLFVLISEKEAFGLVYLEAMIASCIVVGSKNEGIDGIIKNNKNGYLIPSGNETALVNLLLSISESSIDELKNVAYKGHMSASEFSDSNVAKWYLHNVINSNGSN